MDPVPQEADTKTGLADKSMSGGRGTGQERRTAGRAQDPSPEQERQGLGVTAAGVAAGVAIPHMGSRRKGIHHRAAHRHHGESVHPILPSGKSR